MVGYGRAAVSGVCYALSEARSPGTTPARVSTPAATSTLPRYGPFAMYSAQGSWTHGCIVWTSMIVPVLSQNAMSSGIGVSFIQNAVDVMVGNSNTMPAVSLRCVTCMRPVARASGVDAICTERRSSTPFLPSIVRVAGGAGVAAGCAAAEAPQAASTAAASTDAPRLTRLICLGYTTNRRRPELRDVQGRLAAMPAPTVWVPAQVPQSTLAHLPEGIDLRIVPHAGPIEDAPQHGDILISGYDQRRTVEVLPQLRDLKVIQTLSAGVDIVAPHVPPGVILCDAAGVHDIPVAEWVAMVILAMRRQLPDHVLSQRDAAWRWLGVGDDLEDATVLIVGHGSIGHAVEARLAPFGARFLRVARHPRDGVHGAGDLAALLPQADVVVILVPLTDETRGMVDAAFLASMREGALLVNAARGQIADTAALLDALRGEHIKAALDVTDPEPLPDGHPLWSAPGVLITPHIGGAARRVFERAMKLAGAQVRRYINGEPLLNVVIEGY